MDANFGDEEGSPDTRTGCYEKVTRDNDFSYQDVEVVTFDSNSNLSLIDFLLNTKLSKNKAYDDKTTILCFVDKEIIIPPHQILNQTLINKKLKSQSPIILVGKVYPNKNIYSLAQIYPTIDLVLNEFDVIEECKNRPLKILKLNRFAKGAIDFKPNSEEKHYPFEKLGIK